MPQLRPGSICRILRHTDARWIGMRCKVVAIGDQGVATVQIIEPGLEQFQMVFDLKDLSLEQSDIKRMRPHTKG